MSTDLLSNMLSSIKNASMSGKFSIEVPYSKLCEETATIMMKKGFLREVKVFKEKGKAFKKLTIVIASESGISRISDIKRISKPGSRVYKQASALKRVAGGYGVAVISTPRGLVSDEEARKKRLGGEVLCEVL